MNSSKKIFQKLFLGISLEKRNSLAISKSNIRVVILTKVLTNRSVILLIRYYETSYKNKNKMQI